MYKNIFISLNGWQRIFIFIVLFLYLPITILSFTDVKSAYVSKYSDEQLNKKIDDFIRKEKIPFSVKIEMYNPSAEVHIPLDIFYPSENPELIEFNSSDKQQKYQVLFNFSNKQTLLNEEVNSKKMSIYIQELVDENKAYDISTNEYLKIVLYFILTSSFTYFFGFMIAWVKKGFQQSKG